LVLSLFDFFLDFFFFSSCSCSCSWSSSLDDLMISFFLFCLTCFTSAVEEDCSVAFEDSDEVDVLAELLFELAIEFCFVTESVSSPFSSSSESSTSFLAILYFKFII